MFSKPENAPVVKANALENSVAVQQTMVEDGDLRVRFGVKFSVDVNLRFLHAQRSGPWATFNRGFNYRVRSRFVSFGFVSYRCISSFHNRKKMFDVYSRNSSSKMNESYNVTAVT